ncbi:predicted protein [Streptomyces sp. C]|nr:predicted protein [Streptomyces sp. C]
MAGGSAPGPAGPFPLTAPLPGPIRGPQAAPTRGTLTPAEGGCGTFLRLVLNGHRRGPLLVRAPAAGGGYGLGRVQPGRVRSIWLPGPIQGTRV